MEMVLVAMHRSCMVHALESMLGATKPLLSAGLQTNNVELLAPLLADKVVETTEEGRVLVGKAAVPRRGEIGDLEQCRVHGSEGHAVRPYGHCHRHLHRQGSECGG